jgi:hypothetical protein
MSDDVMERTDDLVDHEMLARWQSDHAAAAERLVVARQALAKAQGEHTAAGFASERAITNGGDVLAAEIALEAAARRHGVAQKVYDAAAAAVARSNDRRQIVSGLAHKGLYEHGIRQRIAAARRWDLAKAEVAAAEADRAAADTQMRRAMQSGTYDLFGALDHPDLMRTEERERQHWRSRGIDPDCPRHPARMPTELTAAEAHEQGLVKLVKDDVAIHVHPSAVAAHVQNGWKDLSDVR